MAKRSYAHGTPEQMLAAFQSKVAELGGNVSACRTVSAASFVDTDGQFGEPGATISEQEIRDYWDREHMNDPSLSQYGEDGFDEWYRDTKQWLSPVKADSYKSVETNPEATSRFIHTLVGDVNAALEANSELDSWTWEEKENDLVLTTIAGDSINEYSIPKADLTLDWDRISEDVDYILNEVQSIEDDEVFDRARQSDVVESSQTIEGVEYKHWDEIAEQYLHEMQAVNIDISDKPAVLNELMNNFGFTQEDAEGLFVRINECASDLSQPDAEDLLEAGWFDNASRDVISAGWTEEGEIIVSLNHGVDNIEDMAAELTSYIEDNNYHVIDWNVNGSNVFTFEVIHNDEYAALSESDEYFTPEEDPEDEDEGIYSTDSIYDRDPLAGKCPYCSAPVDSEILSRYGMCMDCYDAGVE